MRNLKKLLAVILTVVMITSMMIPALAANTYEAEALKLQAINVFAGGPEDLKLDEGVTRIQGLTFAIRIAGKDAEALAMDDAEVAEILADWTDADSIPAWGKKYAAYAIKNNITVGLSTTEKIFGAMNPITGTSFMVFIMKSGMGYADVTTANVLDAAVNAGIVTASQAVTFAEKALIRDDAAAIMYGAFATGVNADGTKLIDAYIASGATTKEAAIAAGFVAKEVVPDKFEVLDVTAINLKEIVVTFSRELDADELDKADFTFSPSVTIDDPILADDNKTVTLYVSSTGKLVNQTKEYTLTIRDVKDINGNNIAKTVVKFKATDATLPTVEDIVITGPKSFDIIFNEPVDSAVIGNVKVKSASTTLSTKALTSSNFDKNKVSVELYTALSDGKNYTIEISDFKDYAGYTNVLKVYEFTYTKSATAPVASIEKATQEYVVVKFDKPVKGLSKANFYHSFSAWQPMNIYKNKDDMDAGVNAITTADSVDTVYAKFATDGSTGQYPLQPGEVKVFIKGKVGSVEVKDNWDNKLGDVELIAHVVADTTPPEVTNIEVKGPKELKITFNEAIKTAKTSNFTIVDENGKSIAGLGFTVALSADSKSVTLNLTKDLTGKTIAITIKDIVDKTINENKMVAYTETIEFGDSEFKGLDRVEYNSTEKVLYVVFKEDVNDSAIDISNYRIKLASGKEYELDGPASFYGSNKVVKIDLSNTEAGYAAAAGAQLVIRNVEDLAGNEIFVITASISPVGTTQPDKKWIRATGKNEVKIQFDQELLTVDAEEFFLSIDNKATWEKATGVETQVNDDGTLVVLTFASDIPANVGTNVFVKATFANTENAFGAKPKNITDTAPADYIAPSVVTDGIVTKDSDGDGKIDQIIITFDEALSPAYVSAHTWTVEGRTVTTASLSTNVVTLNLKVDDDVLVDTAVTPDVTQVLDVKDAGLNGVLTAEAFNEEEYETVDKAAPVIISATKTNATTIVVKLSEEVTENLLTAGTGFTVVDDNSDTYAVSAAEFDGDTITLTVANMSSATGDIKLSYATQSGKNQDKAGNDLATKAAFKID